MKKRYFLTAAILIAVFQTAIIGLMMAKHGWQSSSGQEVLLQSRFADPRDLFRGHYVTLNLRLGDLQKETTDVDKIFRKRGEIFVELRKGDAGFWIAKKLWHEIPKSEDGIFIKGKLTFVPQKGSDSFQITLPQDRYFAPKKRAQELEKFRREQKLGVILSVTANGEAYIRGITIDGKKIYDQSIW